MGNNCNIWISAFVTTWNRFLDSKEQQRPYNKQAAFVLYEVALFAYNACYSIRMCEFRTITCYKMKQYLSLLCLIEINRLI